MAITILTGGTQAAGVNNGNPVTLTFPTLAEGDVVIVFGGHFARGGTTSAVPSGYTTIYDSGNTLGTDPHFAVSYKVMGATPDTSVSCPGSGNAADGTAYGCYCLRGVDTANIQDATRTLAGPTTSNDPDAPSITTATNGAFVLALALDHIAGTGDTSITVPSGYSELRTARGADNNDATVAGAALEKASFGTEDPPSFTTWTAGTWRAVTVAVRPEAGVALEATSLTSTAPVFGTPAIAIFDALAANEFATAAPVIDAPAIVQIQVLPVGEFAVGTPAFDTPAFSQHLTFSALELMVGAPLIGGGTAGQEHDFTATSLVTGAVVIPTPTLSIPSVLWMGDRILDFGLAALAETDTIMICTEQPADYAAAVALSLGEASVTFSAPGAGSPSGRLVTSAPVVDAPVTANGTPTCWVAVDSVNSRLLAIGPADGFEAVQSGAVWSLGAIPIHAVGASR